MGQKQEKLRRILERDDYRCGIHLGGCGERLSEKDAEIAHIEPKTMCTAPYDEIASEEIRRSIRRKQLDDNNPILLELNIQPMHRSCNQKMGSSYPPVPIITHCSCCEYMYIAKRNKNSIQQDALEESRYLRRHVEILPKDTDEVSVTVDGIPAGIALPSNPQEGDRFFLLDPDIGKGSNPDWVLYMQEWRPVLPRDDDDTWQWRAEKIALLRRIKHDGGICYVSRVFTLCVGIEYDDGMTSPDMFGMFGNRKDGRRQAGLIDDVRIGNLISIDHMLQHNLSRYNNPQIIWGTKMNLSAEEVHIITLLPWGCDWSNANWCKSEFDDFGICAVSPKGGFARRVPQTANKVFVWINPKREKIVSVP